MVRTSLGLEKTVSHLDSPNSGFKMHLFDFLHSSALEYMMSLIILGNFVLIIAETNKRAQESDNEIPEWMDITSWIVLGLFTVELIGRLYVTGLSFFQNPWNVFDCLIISADLIFSLVAEIFSSLLPISLLRILRLAKVCRISKVFRIFPELRLMLGGLIGAVRAIIWGTVLMGIAILICAVLAVQFIHPLNKELAEQGVYDGCYRCEDKFATVQDAALTFWQQIMAGDSWGQVTIPIIYAYPASALYFLFVFLLLAMALQNLILGVIVDVAQESRKKMQYDTEKKKVVVRMESQTHLLQMCRDMDLDKSGELTKEELFTGYEESPGFRGALQELDVQQADLDVVWLLMDKDKSGCVAYEEFVTELYNMRSSEGQFMLTYIKYYVTLIKDRILEEIKIVENEMKAVERDVKHVEEMEKHRQSVLYDDDEKSYGNRSRAVTEEAPNAPSEVPPQEGNGNRAMGRHAHHMSEALFNDLVKEIRQNEARVTAMLETIDAKVDFSISEQMQRTRGSFSWSLPLPCQSVSSGPGSQKVVIQTPASSRPLSRQQTDRVLSKSVISHGSGPGSAKGSTDQRNTGGRNGNDN